jgi:signal transduction histidine kinase
MIHLRTKLILSYACVIALCLALAAVVSTVLLRRYESSFTNQRILAIAETTALILHENNDPATFDAATLLKSEASQTGTRLILVEASLRDVNRLPGAALDVTVLQDTSGKLAPGTLVPIPREVFVGWRQSLAAAAVRTGTPVPRVNAQLTLPGPYRFQRPLPGSAAASIAIMPLRGEKGTVGAFRMLIVTETPGSIERPFASLVVPLGWAAVIAFLVSSCVALLLARSIARPLLRLTAATRALAHGDFAQRVPVHGDDEVAELGSSFNTMAGEIEATRQRERDFLANISHDLKTPLTSIQGFAGAIVDGTCPPDAYTDAARIIYAEAERMGGLVGDVLQLTRLEAGQLTLELAPIDLARLLHDSARRFSPAAAQAGVTVEVQTPAEGAVIFAGDRGRLDQVLGNLIENALRYTPRGGSLQLLGDAEDTAKPPSVTITVHDTGAGMPPADVPRIFERFYQADKARAAGRGGSGLGLAIVKELVERHGGTIRAESALGVGTSIVLTLPRHAGPAAGPPGAVVASKESGVGSRE